MEMGKLETTKTAHFDIHTPEYRSYGTHTKYTHIMQYIKPFRQRREVHHATTVRTPSREVEVEVEVEIKVKSLQQKQSGTASRGH